MTDIVLMVSVSLLARLLTAAIRDISHISDIHTAQCSLSTAPTNVTDMLHINDIGRTLEFRPPKDAGRWSYLLYS